MRPLLGLVLALVLTLTGQSMAIARGASDATGQMVICTGAGVVVVAVDDEGNPTGPPHICPDCALSVFAGLATPGIVAQPATGMWQTADAPAHDLPTLARGGLLPQARGPPLAA